MAMNKLSSGSHLVIYLLIIVCLHASSSRGQPHHLQHPPGGFLLDLESAAAAADAPIVCHGDSLNNNFHRNQHPVKVITDDADLFIGALLNVHDSNPGGGFFSCGNITASGLIAYEALNWISSTINQEHGLINGKPVVESFIPGVRIGIRAYDSCGHKELSKIHLMDMFPILETGSPRSCQSVEESSGDPELRIPGVIDVTGVIHDPVVSEVTRKHFIPILPMNMRSALPPEVVAKIMHQIMHDLNWTRVAIIHSMDEHSTHVVKLLGQKTLNSNICFTSVDSLQDEVSHVSGGYSSSSDSSSERKGSSRNYEETQKKVFESIVSRIPDEDTPIFVIGFGQSINTFTKIVMQESQKSSKFQWFFSSLPDPEILSLMHSSSASFSGDAGKASNIFALAPFPGKFAKFEDHWRQLQSSHPVSFTSWFDEYICQTKEGCDLFQGLPLDRALIESDGQVLWRTYQVMPIIHSIFTFSHAIRNAWMDQCQGVRGLCPSLKSMRREEFIQRFLEPLLDPENTGSGGLGGGGMSDRGGRDSRGIGKLNWKLAFTSFFTDPLHGLQFNQHILYDSFSNEATFLNKDAPIKVSTCSGSECNACVKIRQSRMEEVETTVTVTQSTLVVSSDDCNSSKCSTCFSQWTAANAIAAAGSGSAKSSSAQSPPPSSSSSSTSSSQSSSPSLGSNFRRTWGMITAASSGIGVICVLLCGLYFLMVFPVRVGTTILGYMILFGLLVVYLVNFLFVLQPTVSICWLRRIGMSLGYCMILSGMLVKAMNTWRRMSYKMKQRSDEPIQIASPSGLMGIACGLVAVHLFVTIVWLYLFPPKPSIYEGTWKCYPAQSFMIDTESVVSLLYIILLIFLIMFFCLLTWKSYDNHREPRFIFYSCSSIAIIWLTWMIMCYKNFLSYKSRNSSPNSASSSSSSSPSSGAGIDSKDLMVICANLTSASLVMILLYLRKLYWYSKIKRKDRLIRSRLQTANFPANFYGALHSRNYGHNWQTADAVSSYTGPSTAASSVRGSISSVAALTFRSGHGSGCLNAPDASPANATGVVTNSNAKRKNSTKKKPFQDDDEHMDDGTMSCASAASSVQVQGEELYPMEIYDCGSQFQPSSLFSTANGKVYNNGTEN